MQALKTTYFFFSLLVISFSLHCAELAGVSVPDSIQVQNKSLVLNGIGIRRGTFLNVKVYVGSLYLPSKSKDPQAILDMPYPKQIAMNFLRDVPEAEIKGAWKEGFEAAIPLEKRKTLQKFFEEFNGLMGELKKKQVIIVNFLEKGVEVTFNGKKHAIIGNKDFSRALLSIWFINARDEQLRDELLGKN